MTKRIGKHLVTALAAWVLILGSVPGNPRQAEDPAVLLRAAIEKEEVDGDLQAAVVLYESIVAKFGDNRPVAAKALLRLGGCYEKLGQSQAELAHKAFQRVVDSYPDQTEAVKLAREKLAASLKSRASVEKGGNGYRIVKIHTDPRPGWPSPDGTKLALLDIDKDVLWLRDLGSGKETC